MQKVKVLLESDTGRNIVFQDTGNGHIMSDKEFISRIENEKSVYHKYYYVRRINGIKTAVSKPNGKKNDNLN